MCSFRSLLCAVLLAACAVLAAQESRAPWQEVWHEVMSAGEQDDEGEGWEETFELLQQLADAPLNLNHCTREELEQLPFLSSQQVMDMQEYLQRYGPMRSIGELRMVRSLDYAQLQLLPFFVYVGTDVQDKGYLPHTDTITRRGRHELSATLRLPFYTRRGDNNGYLGYRYRHELRYEFSYADRVRIGLVGAQDAGEPFFAGRNRWGYDGYSYYAQIKQWGVVENIVVGKYRLCIGKGLVLGSSFSIGKLALLQSLGRVATMLRPHASRSETDYLQGVAATLRLSPSLRLTPYVSYRPVDATLDADGNVSTLITTGYHRTPQEMEKKHNTYQTDAGVHAEWRHNGLRAGLTAAYTHNDRSLQPNTAQLYRRYQAAGRDFLNLSADYGYTAAGWSLQGETATDGHGHLATLNTVSYQPSAKWSLLALQRFYSYRYHTLRGHAPGEGGHVQNESGLLVGATWRPLHRWQIQAYADYAHFPWARYLTSQPSESTDLLVAMAYELNSRWTLKARYRWHRRERDDETKDDVQPLTDQRLRLGATFTPSRRLRLTTQADLSQSQFRQRDRGLMLSSQCTLQQPSWQMAMTAAWFHTDSYQSRLYLYESQLPHQFAAPSYYGHGVRLSLLARADVGKRWRLAAKLGYTKYFDRSSIGTGLQETGHSSMTEAEVQGRYRF